MPQPYQLQFVNKFYAMAVASQASSGVPAIFTLAQGALESGWGKSKLAIDGNNFFGIKDFDKIVGNEIFFWTKEQTADGQTYSEYAAFRKFGSPQECFIYHANFFKKNIRYKNAFNFTDDYDWAREVSKAGYSTKKTYYPELCSTITTIKRILKLPNTNPVFDNEAGLSYDPKTDGVSTPLNNDTYIIVSKEQSAQDFIDQYFLKLKPDELISYKENGKAIVKSYNTKQLVQYNKKASTSLLGIGARLSVPLNKMASRSIYTINTTLVQNRDYNTFIEKEIRRLLNNPAYMTLNNKTDVSASNSIVGVGSVLKRQDKHTVWVWSKTLDGKGEELFDLSPFVESIQCNTTENGSNVTIQLPHITFSYDKDGKRVMDVKMYFDKKAGRNVFGKTTVHERAFFNESMYRNNNFFDDNQEVNSNSTFGYLKRKDSFFNNIIQTNDLIFIELENTGQDYPVSDEFIIPSDQIKGRYFDIIGMVDTLSMSSSAEASDQSLTLTSKCLSKLIIDDGVYFFPVEYAVKDREQIIKNSSASRSGNRLIANISDPKNQSGFQKNISYTQGTGALIGDTQFNFDRTQTIAEWITFIFSQLTNIDVCPDALFSNYDDKSFIISRDGDINTTNNQTSYKRVQANGIWQIVKLVLDKEIVDRKVVDSTLATDTGSLINLIRKVCQKPWVDFYMDTYGDKFYFIVRKPPYTYQSFKTNFCINVFEHDVMSDGLDYATDEIYTWYKVNPFASVFGFDENSGYMSFFPAVMFPEYVELWGNRAMEVNSNFLDFDVFNSEDTQSNFDRIQKQAYEDMDWLIESHAYLPFTRKGVITVKPDRRIKRGMSIRYFPTGEIFHVDAVSHTRLSNAVTDGVTQIYVSRGMVEQHMEKYFKIINLQKYSTKSDSNTWTVNQEIFKFFLTRQQWMK